MESTENLKIGGMRLIQRDDVLKIGADSILLAAFSRPKRGEKTLELGCGGGVIELLLMARRTDITIDAVELDQAAFSLALRNMALNNIGRSVRLYNRDLRDLSGFDSDYSLAVANPPYRRLGSGKHPSQPSMLRALFESDCTVGEVCLAAAARLKNGGRFCAVYPPERLCDLFCALRQGGLEPKRLALVRHTAAHIPSLALVEARKGGAPGLKLVPTLTLKNAKGGDTKRYRALYEGGSL